MNECENVIELPGRSLNAFFAVHLSGPIFHVCRTQTVFVEIDCTRVLYQRVTDENWSWFDRKYCKKRVETLI